MLVCWSCEAPVPDDAGFCPRCGRSQRNPDAQPIFVVDGATELFNGVFLQAIVGQEVNRALRYQRPLSAVVVEVDHGETLVQHLGPDHLRAVLKELGSVISAAVRDTDTVGFLDCERTPRFGVVLPETDASAAVLVADKVRSAIAMHEFESGGQWRRLTVSCGTAAVSPGRSGEQALIEDAVAALVAGREAGAGPNHTFLPAHA